MTFCWLILMFLFEFYLTRTGMTVSSEENGLALMGLVMDIDLLYFLFSWFNLQGPDGKAGDYKWYTYNEFWEKIQDIASGLIYQNLVPEKDGVYSDQFFYSQYRILGVYGKNSIDWVLSEQSCNAYNMTLCPIYDTLGADSVEFILQQTEMKTCVCAPEETVKVIACNCC